MNVVLIDGKWMAYRMHFSHIALQTSDGKPTGMLHGFMQGLLHIHKKLPDAAIIVCWDGKGPTWRHRLYPAYKQNRQPNPQMPRMQQGSEVLVPLLRQLGFWVMREKEVEADDMIGMASYRLSYDGHKVRIHSSDQDMYQLVRADSPSIWPKVDEKPITERDVKRVFGVNPCNVCEIRAMAGDSSDNLKGLKGVGIKTAIRYWKEGLRPVSTLVPSWASKYKPEWPRVLQEYKLAQIIRDPQDNVWSKDLKRTLSLWMDKISERPGRFREHAERNREDIYRTFARYELAQLIADRHILFNMP